MWHAILQFRSPGSDIPSVTSRRRQGVRVDQWGVPDRNAAGEPICRWCRTVVRPPRRTFCSDPCVHEWRVRTDLTYVREQVFARDQGTCQLCRTELRSAERRWRRQQPPPHDRTARRRWRHARPRWEADHVIPVADGGGDCGLENYRLLCRTCHVSVTTAWRRHRRSATSINAEGMGTDGFANH